MKEYAIYPFEYMRITQNHKGEIPNSSQIGNHLAHWKPNVNYSDKPWDEAGKDGGRDYFVAKNEYKIVEKLGSQSGGYAVRLETTHKVYIPYKDDAVILEITLTHLNYDDWSKLSNGQILKVGTKIMREGTSGGATGNHFHITANLGKYYGLLQNSNGKWCFTYEKSLLPDEAYYVDGSVKILDANGYKFKEVPNQKVGKPVERNTKVDQLKVKVPELRARKTPSLNGEILGYMNEGYYDIQDKTEADGYTWYKVQDMWIAYSKDWEDILPKEVTPEDIQKEYIDRVLEQIKNFLYQQIEK